MIKHIILTLTGCVLLIGTALSQKYGTTLGLRFANDQTRMIGLTAQQKLLKHITFEGILQSDLKRNTTAHALLKKHYPVLGKRLNLYAGSGISIGNEESVILNEQSKQVITTYDNATLGADLLFGAELSLLGFNVSLDYKPNFNITGRENWYQGQVGISARMVLIKDKAFKKKKRKRERKKRREERRKVRSD